MSERNEHDGPIDMQPEDFLCFIFYGEYNGKDYDFDPDQVERMRQLVEQIATTRMIAMTEVPPLIKPPVPPTPPPPPPWMPFNPSNN